MGSRIFGTTKHGEEIRLYTIQNENGLMLSAMEYGATIVSLKVPDGEGNKVDVVLGYDSLHKYEEGGYYFGAVIGRNANRIADASCVIAKTQYDLERNDCGNNLHSGTKGFHNCVWKLADYNENMMSFVYESAAFEQGFPGNMTAKVIYELTKENELRITYKAESDADTVANFTNHSYFNLDGHDSGTVEDQMLAIYASYYTPVRNEQSIPTGEIVTVRDTPMDFRREKRIGEEINVKFNQLKYGQGYDHNYVLDKAEDAMQLAAVAKSVNSKITMEVYTTCQGMQFYSGNFIRECRGKKNATYQKRQGFCLETQYLPNAVNEARFPTPLLKANETYRSKTSYHFVIK